MNSVHTAKIKVAVKEYHTYQQLLSIAELTLAIKQIKALGIGESKIKRLLNPALADWYLRPTRK